MCNEAVHWDPYTLDYALDCLKAEEMYEQTMCENPAAFFLIPNHFKIQGMCIKAVEVDLWQIYDVPDYLKTQEICDDVVWGDPCSLQYVPDWFVAQQQLKIWEDYDDCWNGDDIIEWYDGYQKSKDHKAKIKEELIPIAWHPNRVIDWCMSEDEKRWWK